MQKNTEIQKNLNPIFKFHLALKFGLFDISGSPIVLFVRDIAVQVFCDGAGGAGGIAHSLKRPF